jgi:hypothetical protein
MLYIFRQRWKDGPIIPISNTRLAPDCLRTIKRSVMKAETIETLRAQAKKLGLSGYSKLRKDELIKLIASQKRKGSTKSETKTRKTASRTILKQKKSRRTPGKSASATPAKPSPVPVVTPVTQSAAEAEQQVESAKYAFALPGAQEPAYAADLGEDIERLPEIREPLLCLLPQKPGVLHGYWILPAASRNTQRSARLRLATYTGDKLTILEEHPLPSERGHFYFNIEQGVELGKVYLQLGRYQPNGEFVSIIQRGIARIPSLYASTQTDRRWWVNDAQFREMYRRAGGLESDRQLGWAGSTSSPGGALSWPGNTSSR